MNIYCTFLLASGKIEISIWLFIALVLALGCIIGLIMNFFTSSKDTSNYKDDHETDDYDYDFD